MLRCVTVSIVYLDGRTQVRPYIRTQARKLARTQPCTSARTRATIGHRTVGTREKYSPMFSRDKEIERAVQTKNVLVHVALRYDKYCVSRWTP
jgi:hypothetical protein